MARGINKEDIFHDKNDKKVMQLLIKKYLEKVSVEIHAYCIMSNHLHILIKAEMAELSKYMAYILSAFAEYYNRKKNRSGYVFQSRYKSQSIEDERYYWSCLRYIHMNPVKANLTKDIRSYLFSSFGEFSSPNSNIIHENAKRRYKETFKGQKEFLWFHNQPNRILLDDVESDMDIVRVDISMEILADLQEKASGIPMKEVLKMPLFKTNFRREIRKTLHLSDKKTDVLIKQIEKVL
ncbi:hypothetical protein C3B58_00670 [Lactonifactor longoviformis]|uniref:REP element-mobilizing transposase RayT n=2 Tax=Lactonifactor TaxID=420345 RepID=A0A1M4XR31_9CLOT|nr:transposase [Lactonifactor longoviformis]POP34929.1 hypothetical protein C3B58_00670 [Lactonifactor longoviformis]SHE96037.1 REP element-mobilizing transposase RayT [Lactonifactor longoviformis DSM 17459]